MSPQHPSFVSDALNDTGDEQWPQRRSWGGEAEYFREQREAEGVHMMDYGQAKARRKDEAAGGGHPGSSREDAGPEKARPTSATLRRRGATDDAGLLRSNSMPSSRRRWTALDAAAGDRSGRSRSSWPGEEQEDNQDTPRAEENNKHRDTTALPCQALFPPETRPDPLSFLDQDSPGVTEEAIRRSFADASAWRMPGPEQLKASPTGLSNMSSPTSSGSSGFRSDGSGSTSLMADRGTEPSTSPEASILDGRDGALGSPTQERTPTAEPRVSSMGPGRPATLSQIQAQHEAAQRQHRAYRYGTPEMPRGSANHPHLPPGALNPRVPNAGHPKHLPRAEKLPLTGYELLASRLSAHPSSFAQSRRNSIGASSVRSGRSAGNSSGMASLDGDGGAQTTQLKPIYRKFEVLNHRLLLHLQDELSELEEQLRRLDTADTQTRRLQNRILPASRRAEYMSGGELQWHRTDILGKIGYKLGQYNHVLSSFAETQRLASPSLSDVENYRTYLATQQPIAEIETRFLDPIDDLITTSWAHERSSALGAMPPPSYLHGLSGDVLTPMPRAGAAFQPPASPSTPSSSASPGEVVTKPGTRPLAVHRHELNPSAKSPATSASATCSRPAPIPTAQSLLSGELPHLAVAVAVAALVPILTFPVIPGFLSRMAVVLLVALAVFGAQVQAGTLQLAAAGAATGTGAPDSSHDIKGVGANRDLMICAAVYGGVMAVVAILLC